MDRREGPDPAVDDHRGRALRPAARLRTAAGAHRPRDLPDPALPPARACRRRSGSGRRAGRSRPPSTSTTTSVACASRRRVPSARCSSVLQPMAAAAFDRARPLWEFTLIEGLYDADGTERAAFAMKVHHAVTDGVGGMALLALLVDLTADAAEPTDTPAAPAPEHMNAVALVRESVMHSSRRMLGVVRRVPATVAGATRVDAAQPAARERRARAHGRLDRPHARARDRADVAGHAHARARAPARHVRRVARRREARGASAPRAASTTCSSPRSSAACTATTRATATAPTRCG